MPIFFLSSNSAFMRHSSPENFNELHQVSTNDVEQDCESSHLTGKETKMQILFSDYFHSYLDHDWICKSKY